MGREVEVVKRVALACFLLLCACSAYDPTLATPDPRDGDGGSDRADATPDGDAMPPVYADAGDASDGDDGAVRAGCQPNPDPNATGCPEICPEACNGKDDDCDGRSDESDDADKSCAAPHSESVCQAGTCLVTQCLAGYRDCDQMAITGCETAADDVNNCGACGHVCKIADASSVCMDGKCVVGKCAAGFADCDMDGNTCETRTDTLSDCGACGVTCQDVPNAVPSCASGSCGVGSCKAGFGDCDGNPANGCEQSLDSLQHCGGCNMACNKAGCGGGVCTAADCSSMPGRADCDRDEASCEIDLRSDAKNCGACGNVCKFDNGVTPHATLGCTASGCVANCDAGYGDCDGNYANGCEQPLNTLNHCGMCRNSCAIAHATASCSTGSCQVQSCSSDWADCDSDKKSCETALNTPDHCGGCTTVCNFPNAVEGCGGSAGARVCTLAGCDSNWADCDATAANGCERDVRSTGSGGLGPCLPESNCVKSTNGGREYYVCPTARTWSEARSRCQLQARGDLVQIADASEDTFVKGKISSSVWAGHNDSAHEGVWVWSRQDVPFWQSGAGTLPNQYATWAPGEPNGSGNCGALYTSGQFDDTVCSNSLPYVCEVIPDACTSDATKVDPGQCGCGVPDTDGDGDGFANCNDSCPSDANKRVAGACGCGTPDTDSDGDGTPNCTDGCPNDGAKTSAGACGCGVSDADSDNDGTRDCNESCDNDPNKTSPGTCGCGQPDTDSDTDGAANCVDGCPYDSGTTGACFSFTQSNFTTGTLNFTTAPTSTLNCGTTTINSSNSNPFSNWCGTVPSFQVQYPQNGPEILVIPLKGLTISSGATLRLLGSRPVVFAVRGNVVVDGTIDANASGSTPGAGGNWSCGSSAGGNGSG
ncbi:MAG TPA: C-type lectin domain-containing protein, partial [Polyangiales bacterium]|nr:C-type lectin domain-containing protein [Polyangiales bacterium]